MANQDAESSNFKDRILEIVGELPVSSTQKYRVLLVEDGAGAKNISAQKWWRHDTNSEWKVGKGFKLDHKQSSSLGSMLMTASARLG